MGERVMKVLEGVVVVDQDQGEITLQYQAIVGEACKAQDPMEGNQNQLGGNQDPVGEGLDPLEAVTVDQILRELVEDRMVGEEDLPDHQEEDLVEERKNLVLFLYCQS